MKWRYLALAALTVQLPTAYAGAQPNDLPIPAASSTELPAGISVAKNKGSKTGFVYVDAKGRTLYGMDRRALAARVGNPWQYCDKECAKEWEPVLAPAGSKPTPVQGFGGRQGGDRPGGAGGPGGQSQNDWSIAEGPHGPQWVYKGNHLVFTRVGDKPGSTALDGYGEYLWNVLKYVPPVPKVVAPTNVSTQYTDGGYYALADKDGRLLYTSGKAAECAAACIPFAAGFASRGVGEWTVSRNGDHPQWVFRGKPVYVSQEIDTTGQSAKGPLLRP